MKQKFTYQVYCQDTDGSERKACRVEAVSTQHAISLAKQQGVKNVTDAVKLQKEFASVAQR